MNKFSAEWTGGWPALCHGDWIIMYNDDVFDIPDDKSTSDMNTYGEYSKWHFEDWMEVWEDYTEGLQFEEWIKENEDWIIPNFERLNIEQTQENFKELYDVISEQDFRSGSCGGCI